MRGWSTALIIVYLGLWVAGVAGPGHADVERRVAMDAWLLPQELAQEGPLAAVVVREVELRPSLTFFSPGYEDEWVEGAPVTIEWVTTGPVRTVRLYYYGGLTKLGGKQRGSFSNLIVEKIPNQGFYHWQVPWMDARGFILRIAGFDAAGAMIAEAERGVRLRPRELAELKGTFISVIRKRQRLYYYDDNNLKWISIVSTARRPYNTPPMHPGSYDRRRGAMGQVFRKSSCAWSRMYTCWMPWWMAVTSSGSHGIHATSRGYYRYLGNPASHGCIRQHRADAKQLYHMVAIGTSVHVF